MMWIEMRIKCGYVRLCDDVDLNVDYVNADMSGRVKGVSQWPCERGA